MRFEICYSPQFSVGTLPITKLLPTDILIIKYNLKIKEHKIPLLFFSPTPTFRVLPFISQRRFAQQNTMLNLGMSVSHLGLLQPSSHPVTGPKVSLQLTQIFLCQEPINLEIRSGLTPCVSGSSAHPYATCPFLHKVKLHPRAGDYNHFRACLRILNLPLFQGNFRPVFSPLSSCTSPCELCFTLISG